MGFLSPPKPPSPASQAKAQIKVNRDTALLNSALARPNTTDIYGNTVNWSQTGTDPQGNPILSAVANLSPENRALLTQLISAKGGIGQAGINLAMNIGSSYGTLPDFLSQAVDPTSQIVQRQLAYMTPYYNQQTQNLENQLVNQGLKRGTPAFDNAMRTLQQNQNLSQGQFVNQAQAQIFNQLVTQYQLPVSVAMQIIQAMGPLTGGAPNVPQIGQAGAPNMITAAQNAYSNQANQFASTLNLLGGAGSAIASLPIGGGATLGGAAGTAIGSGLASMLGLLAV